MVKLLFKNLFLCFCLLLLAATGCKRRPELLVDLNRPQRILTKYFNEKYLLYRLPDNCYTGTDLNHSFRSVADSTVSEFEPLGFDPKLNLQYNHIYSEKCIYHKDSATWKYAEVCFPNTCLTNDKAYAKAHLTNTSLQPKTYYLRLFYQNTTYWFPTNDSINLEDQDYLDNYYGASDVISIWLDAKHDTVISIPYSIGMDPKGEFSFDPSKAPARPGNYEFMLVTLPSSGDALLDKGINLQKMNPFAEVKKDELLNGGKKYSGAISYTGPHHFKFVFLDEYFDGQNDLNATHVYIVKNGQEKKLCDTCTGVFKEVINESWRLDDFFKGFIYKAPFVHADYGIRKENCSIDSKGVTITIPASKAGDYKKTWGEFLFGPAFKYGHLTVRAKFAQMMNGTGTPNGIIHNLWLYQRDPDAVDTTNPYSYLHNSAGKQPYEIDFEIWNSEDGINTMWDDSAFINYSIVDYMRDAHAIVKPGERKWLGKYEANRLNKRQLNIPGGNLGRDYFNSFHTYELYWYPDHVRFLVDGNEQAVITKDMAKIPDKYAFLWIGSPLYQDGTYYAQSSIPFLVRPKQSVIDYIRIE
jgi:hypothetical protein